jgi:serine/threonine protein kinase/Tol biopolymer transport system component
MIGDHYDRIDRIFVAALQLAPEQRLAFVRSECGADDALRSEVLSLLSAAEESRDFMARPALERLSEAIATHGWRIQPGDRIGAYTVLGRLGAGGASEVWRAKDERIGRDVAIKVLLPHLSSDIDRLRRFAEEAKTAGALNHSNVLAIYDVGEFRGLPFLVSECLEGESLRSRVEKGPLAVDRAVAIALQVARGLAAAHARSIVHRDLKPDNVFLTADNGVKILDFGIAKLRMPDAASVRAPTHTLTGMIVGTAGYMAPEQIRGDDVDARADLFALGVVLFEMLSGRRPFGGDSIFETLHAILTVPAPDLAEAAPHVPPAVSDVVRRLLEKAPGSRFQSAVDLAWALERTAGERVDADVIRRTGPRSSTFDTRPVRLNPGVARWARWLPATGLALAIASAPWWVPGRGARAIDVPPMTRFTWSLPPGTGLDSAPVVSPDHRRIAFTGQNDGNTRLFVRDLASVDAVAVGGTEGAKQPFWSPDGTYLAFFANGKLMTVAVEGGAPMTIASAPDARGGTWGASGVIVFQSHHLDTGLSQVPAAGGEVRPATLLDVTGPDTTHRWPAFLPDGVHFVYQVVSTVDERGGVYLGAIAAPAEPAAPLFRSSSGAAYVPLPGSDAGLLLSAEGRWIEARTFDPVARRVVGGARRVDIPAQIATPQYPALFSASAELLTFASTEVPSGYHVATASRTSADLVIGPERAIGGFLRLSPDGGRLARTRLDPIRANNDIWIYDLGRGTQVRVTTSRDHDVLPVWSPDGSRMAYRSGTNASPTLKVSGADGVGPVQTLPCPRPYCEPTDWSPDGFLVVNVSGGDVWAVPVDPSGPARPLLTESFMERDARMSPDGRWLAFVSDESGRPVVSVRGVAAPARRFVVSMSGGDQPVWRRDGKELFYVDAERFMQSVSVRTTADGGLAFGAPRSVSIPRFAERHWGTVYDVSPDGSRVYFPHPGSARVPHEFGVVLGWRALLER